MEIKVKTTRFFAAFRNDENTFDISEGFDTKKEVEEEFLDNPLVIKIFSKSFEL